MVPSLKCTAVLALATSMTQQQNFGVSSFSIGVGTGRPSTITRPTHQKHRLQRQHRCSRTTLSAKSPEFRSISSEEEGIPIPFVDVDGQSFIECYADSIAEVDGVEYTIGVPCDYAVALCFFEQGDGGDDDYQLVPLELDDPKMDEIFPIAESIVEAEFGDELVLQRTPQTLTLVGELEDDDEEGAEDFGLDGDDEDDDDDDDDEEVEVLVAFEQDGRQYNLVRMLDPMLLVGKMDDDKGSERRLLLTPKESDVVMPVLEEMFLEFREDIDDIAP